MLIGLISDTHGYFDPRLKDVFAQVDQILHAGDVGSMEVARKLEGIAPLTAVRGNADRGLVANRFPTHRDMQFDGCNVHLVHRFEDRQPGPNVAVIVCGHTHEPLLREREGILRINPGSAGRTYLSSEPTVGLLHVDNGEAWGEILSLGPR